MKAAAMSSETVSENDSSIGQINPHPNKTTSRQTAKQSSTIDNEIERDLKRLNKGNYVHVSKKNALSGKNKRNIDSDDEDIDSDDQYNQNENDLKLHKQQISSIKIQKKSKTGNSSKLTKKHMQA